MNFTEEKVLYGAIDSIVSGLQDYISEHWVNSKSVFLKDSSFNIDSFFVLVRSCYMHGLSKSRERTTTYTIEKLSDLAGGYKLCSIPVELNQLITLVSEQLFCQSEISIGNYNVTDLIDDLFINFNGLNNVYPANFKSDTLEITNTGFAFRKSEDQFTKDSRLIDIFLNHQDFPVSMEKLISSYVTASHFCEYNIMPVVHLAKSISFYGFQVGLLKNHIAKVRTDNRF